MGRPGRGEQLKRDLDLLCKQGVRAVVSLTEQPLQEDQLRAKNIAYLHLPIADMQPPTLEDIIEFTEFIERVENNKWPVVVHCGAGMGRTGTMLAVYLVNGGDSAREALAQVRKKRPGSVETAEQEAIVYEYAEYLHKEVAEK